MKTVSDKTFRVIGTKELKKHSASKVSIPASFAYINYDHAVRMWDSEINWTTIRQKVRNNVHGTTKEAKLIENGLRMINQIMLKQSNNLTDDEKDILKDITRVQVGEGHIAQSLLQYSKGFGANAYGNSFEKHFDELLQSFFNQTDDNTSYRSGTVKTQVLPFNKTDISTLGVNIGRINLDILGYGTKILSGDSYKTIREEIRKVVKEDTGKSLQELLGRFLEFEYKNEQGKKQLFVYRMGVQQKIDIDVPTTVQINADLSPEMQQLATAMVGKTFSLKNYSSQTVEGLTFLGPGVGIGDAAFDRRLSSFLYFAKDGQVNAADAATFVYATENSTYAPKTMQRYTSWMRILYELFGVGQRADNRLPDYFVVNLHDLGQVRVINTLDYLKGMPREYPSFLLDNQHLASPFT